MASRDTSLSTAQEVADELARVVDRAVDENSRLGYFAVMYLKVTRSIEQGIADGFFDDAERMNRFTAAFGRHYFDALAAWRGETGDPAPRCWQVAFETVQRARPIALQHLLLGINAHINLDLGVATAETAQGGDLAALRGDYDRINDILAAVMEEVRGRLAEVSPWLDLLEWLRIRHDDVMLRFSLEAARGHAWWLAAELAELEPAQWAGPIKSRDQRIAALGQRVAHPGWLNVVLVPIRLRENGDVASVIETLHQAQPVDAAALEPRPSGHPASPPGDKAGSR